MRALDANEKQEQLALVQWMNFQPILKDIFFHIPNGGSRSRKTVVSKTGKSSTYSPEGVTFKKMGVRAGVFDFFIPLPILKYHGLFVELKSKNASKVSSAQLIWKDIMRNKGYAAEICYGADEAIKVINCYMRGSLYA